MPSGFISLFKPFPNDTAQADPHAGWLRRLADLRRRADRTENNDEALVRLVDEIVELQGRIASTPAHTLAGAASQLDFVIANIDTPYCERVLLPRALMRVRRTLTERA
jgi:hypothetical protein